MRLFRIVRCVLLCLLSAVPAFAGDLAGVITDRSGGALPGATVRLVNTVTSQEWRTVADRDGRYALTKLPAGAYLVTVASSGFSEAVRTVVVPESEKVEANFTLDLGTLRSSVTVTAARGVRDTALVPLRVDTLGADEIRSTLPTSTGDALLAAPGVGAVGSGPFQVRPRLRGLDSTRVLVLVNGERLNNARTATDRAGVEVGLVDVASVDAVEVLGGAGSVLYGTDALSGTINIITNQPRFADSLRFDMGVDGLYSSTDHGRRGTVRFAASARRFAASFVGGVERFDNYRAGGDFQERTSPFFTSGTLHQADTIDDAFGFRFGAFPDPFNAPFTRTRAEVPQSAMHGSSGDLAARVQVASNQELRLRYQRRRADDVGFPDFEAPFFFQSITLPWSRLDKVSASYSFLNLTPWLSRLTASAYYQRQDRLLRNRFPVQFPVPSQSFFPINVFRLDIASDTRQQVETPGVELQATMRLRPDHVVTAGVTWFRDRSEDERTTSTATSIVGEVALGPFGPRPDVFASPIRLGPPSIAHPVRVPNSSFGDVGVFVLDEWDLAPAVRLSGGLRLDGYRVVTDRTPGYDIASLVAGATPAIDPATLPDVNGDRLSRTAVTGEAGVVLRPSDPLSVFAHYVRSYRHPNLEELLFSGPATTGNIVPNVRVEPETGHNVDIGLRLHTSRVVASASYFLNRYDGFISTEVAANSPSGSISQALNLADVRIQGVEATVNVPVVAGGLNWLPQVSAAWTRGTVLEGTDPLTGASLAGAPQDNITPGRVNAGLRVSDRSDRMWAAYGVRAEMDVTRISPLLSDSPFLIAQDLLALDGFAVQRLAFGYRFRPHGGRVDLTLVIDNLTDAFYREQFQFAPARGRSVTVGVSVGR